MIKKNLLIWLISAVLLIAGSVIIFSKKDQQAASDLLPVNLRSIKLPNGWGYEVLVDNKVYIHQDCIPAISTYKKFSTESDALLIGNKVVERIKLGQKPSINEQDIINNHIHY